METKKDIFASIKTALILALFIFSAVDYLLGWNMFGSPLIPIGIMFLIILSSGRKGGS